MNELWSWSTSSKNMIQMIEQHPIIYQKAPTKTTQQYRADFKDAWESIATELGMRSIECIQNWMEIKYKYAKLRSLINTGKVLEEHAKSFKNISKYLDGTLSFLDPYLGEISDTDIPFYIHKNFNALFGMGARKRVRKKCKPLVSHDKIISLLKKRKAEVNDDDPVGKDMIYLQNVVEDVIKRKLKELLSNENAVSNKVHSDPSDSYENTVKIQEDVVKRKQLLQNENTICNSENLNPRNSYENTDEPMIEEVYDLISDSENGDVEDKNINNNNNDSIQHSLPNSDKLDGYSRNDDKCGNNTDTMVIENKTKNIAGVTDGNGISNCDMGKIFNELGEVLSLELSMEKQKLLKKQINGLVKNILNQV